MILILSWIAYILLIFKEKLVFFKNRRMIFVTVENGVQIYNISVQTDRKIL